MHHRRRSRSKSASPGNSTSTSSRSPFTPSPAATPSISYRQNGENDSSTPSPVPLGGGTGIVTSTTIVQSTSSAISQSTTSLASLSYLGIGDRTRKRLSVTATSSRAAVAERTDEERAFESRRRATLLAWEKCVDDDFDYAVPWRRRHLLRLFAQIDVGGTNATGGGGGAPEGDHLDSTMLLLSQEVVDRISSLLRRPLVRVGTEAQRLAARYGRCSRHEVIVAAKLVLPPALAEQAIQAAVRAYSLYGVSAQRFAYSKSARSGLVLPAGAVHRWMLDSSVARVVSECASLYLCAVVESLAEEIYRRVVLEPNDEDSPEENVTLTRDIIERRISADPELWSLLQPHAYLVPTQQPRLPMESPATPATMTPLSPRRTMETESPSARLNSQPPTENQNHTTSPPSRGPSMAPDGASSFTRATRPGSGRSSARRASQRASARRFDAQPLVMTTVHSRSELTLLVTRALYYLQPKQAAQNHVILAPSALDSLFYFMSSARTRSQPAQSGYYARASPFSVDVRAPEVLPGLGEWLRVILLLIEHRRSVVADEDDVRQAARLLLPGVDCMPRLLRLDDMQCIAQGLDSEACATQFQQDLGFRMLGCGRSDLVREAVPLLGKLGPNSYNMQGLTPLMYAAASGDDAMVQLLVQASATTNTPVKSGEQTGWTALTFAVLHGHTTVVKALLESQANPEGSYNTSSQENTTDTPLQLASAGGHLDIVGFLLAFGADPFVTTLRSNMKSTAVNSQWWQGGGNSFALAASHGHRKVLKKLLAQPPPSTRSCDMLSLEEILAEGYVNTEHAVHSSSRAKALQEALYLSSEHGFFDVAMELRSIGVPWNLHCWLQTLAAADRARKLELIIMLLRDFASINHDEMGDEFMQDGIALLFSLFRKYNEEALYRQLASTLCSCYGDLPPPRPLELPPDVDGFTSSFPRIGPEFVNNPEMSDVTFIVEGKPFYAHRIILVAASSKFKEMLSGRAAESSRPKIEIPNLKFEVFKTLIQYLYQGSLHNLNITQENVMEIIQAANFFLLDGLQRHCEIFYTDLLSPENALELYKHSKVFGAEASLVSCEGFFLANMPAMIENRKFRKLLGSDHGLELCRELKVQLGERISLRMRNRAKSVPSSPSMKHPASPYRHHYHHQHQQFRSIPL